MCKREMFANREVVKGQSITLASLKCSGRSSSCTVSMSAALAGASGAVSSAECCSDLSLDDWKADEPGLRPSRTPFSRFMINFKRTFRCSENQFTVTDVFGIAKKVLYCSV